MGIRLRPLPKFQFLTDAGELGNGYKVNCYEPGTATRKDTYDDYTGGSANANPVILDARGEADIHWNGLYKVVITDADDVVVYTVDNYGEGEDATLTGNYNKVKNGGFETDSAGDGLPDDWTITEYDATSTVAIDATDQIEGLNSLKFTSTGLGGGYADSDFFAVREGIVLTPIFMLKSSVVDVRNVVDILWYTGAQALISTTNVYDEAAANPTAWTEKTGEVTAPSTARFAKVRVIGCHSSDATNGSTWFDDVVFPSLPVASTTLKGISPRASQAEVDAGTDTDGHVTPETLAGANADLFFPVAVAGYDRGKTVNIKDDISYSSFSLDSNLVVSTWESIGPTGSGADNIWSGLDIVPLTATHLILKATVQGNDNTTAEKWLSARARENGSAITGLATYIAIVTGSAVGQSYLDTGEVFIPLDSDNIFEGEWDYSSAWGTFNAVSFWLAGWVE